MILLCLSLPHLTYQSEFIFTGYLTCKWTDEPFIQDFWLMKWDTITPDDKIKQARKWSTDVYPYSYEKWGREMDLGITTTSSTSRSRTTVPYPERQ
ncbi:unnamed protein product [Caenorhabditis nigoni]